MSHDRNCKHLILDFRYLSCVLGELAYEHYRHSDNLVPNFS